MSTFAILLSAIIDKILYKNTDISFLSLSIGPLFMNDGSIEPTLVGVTSFGNACGQIKSAAVFAKVDHVLNWIYKTMSKYN